MSIRKSVDDPKVRNHDPECWKCLSDEQRDIIADWYDSTTSEQAKRWAEDDERKEAENNAENINGCIIGIIPFAIYTAFHRFLENEFWSFLFHSVGNLALCSIIFFLFRGAYLSIVLFDGTKPSRLFDVIWRGLGAALVTILVLGQIYS